MSDAVKRVSLTIRYICLLMSLYFLPTLYENAWTVCGLTFEKIRGIPQLTPSEYWLSIMYSLGEIVLEYGLLAILFVYSDRIARRYARLTPGFCGFCGYKLCDSESSTCDKKCPECGSTSPGEKLAKPRNA